MVDSPSGGAPAKAPRWNLADTEGYGGGNSFRGAPRWFQGTWVYIGGRSRSVDARGPTRVGARRAPPWLPPMLLDVHSKSPGSHLFQKDRFLRFHSVWTPFDIPFLRNTEIGKKTTIRAGPPVSRLVQKMI